MKGRWMVALLPVIVVGVACGDEGESEFTPTPSIAASFTPESTPTPPTPRGSVVPLESFCFTYQITITITDPDYLPAILRPDCVMCDYSIFPP